MGIQGRIKGTDTGALKVCSRYKVKLMGLKWKVLRNDTQVAQW